MYTQCPPEYLIIGELFKNDPIMDSSTISVRKNHEMRHYGAKSCFIFHPKDDITDA